MAGYQQKRYIVMKFVHNEKYIAFQNREQGRRRKEVLDGIFVIVSMSA